MAVSRRNWCRQKGVKKLCLLKTPAAADGTVLAGTESARTTVQIPSANPRTVPKCLSPLASALSPQTISSDTGPMTTTATVTQRGDIAASHEGLGRHAQAPLRGWFLDSTGNRLNKAISARLSGPRLVLSLAMPWTCRGRRRAIGCG